MSNTITVQLDAALARRLLDRYVISWGGDDLQDVRALVAAIKEALERTTSPRLESFMLKTNDGQEVLVETLSDFLKENPNVTKDQSNEKAY